MSIGSWIQDFFIQRALKGALERLIQPSTWLGIFGYLGFQLSGASQDALVNAGVAIGAAILVIINEKKLFQK